MKSISRIKTDVRDLIIEYKYLIKRITRELYYNPELGGEEYFAQELINSILKENGFEVVLGILDFDTALKGKYINCTTGPNIGLIVEYDALPEIGHGCGHNASCAISVTSAVILKKVMDDYSLGGSINVIGTPGEENICSKVKMTKEGIFDELDMAMMVHAYDKWMINCRAMALDSLEFVFRGKTSHAAAAPEEGINALDALMLTFSGINCLRQHIKDGSRIHGVVNKGGKVPNVIPDYGSARFYTRASTREYLDIVTDKVNKCAEGAAIATGCSLEINNFETSLDNIKNHEKLMGIFVENLYNVHNKSEVCMDELMIGSTDMGNVSQVIPAIHPLMGLVKEGYTLHTKEFADETIKDYAIDNIAEAVYATVCTALDVILNPELIDEF